MFLKRLDIQGFKSFPQRVRVDFGPGITAVVGPNGSGKTNIVEAIRWVLGEQNMRHLRGDTSEWRRRPGYSHRAVILLAASHPDADDDATVGHDVERCGLLRDVQLRMHGQDDDVQHEPDALGPGRRETGRDHDLRIRKREALTDRKTRERPGIDGAAPRLESVAVQARHHDGQVHSDLHTGWCI